MPSGGRGIARDNRALLAVTAVRDLDTGNDLPGRGRPDPGRPGRVRGGGSGPGGDRAENRLRLVDHFSFDDHVAIRARVDDLEV